MKTHRHITLFALFAASIASCTFYARNEETYLADTRSLVETRNGAVKECYDAALESDEKVSGVVLVNFTVEKKTGTLKDLEVDSASTAPESLSACVVKGLEGLALDPEDQRDGIAQFSWSFKVGDPKPSEG